MERLAVKEGVAIFVGAAMRGACWRGKQVCVSSRSEFEMLARLLVGSRLGRRRIR